MQAFHKVTPGLLLMTALLCLPVKANECPSVTLPKQLHKDDRASLAMLDQQFSSYTLDIDFLTERNALLNTHGFADQQLVVDSFYAKYCNLVDQPEWKLQALERQARLHYAQVKLYQRVEFPAVMLDSRRLASMPLANSDDASNLDTLEFFPQPVGTNTGDQITLATSHDSADQEAHRYLRDTPFQVTGGNRYFVIVSSVKSFVSLISEMRRLKKHAPQFDFVAHAPYAGNPYYGIKIATWVSRSVAAEALAKAKKHVSSSSYLWNCPDEGDRC